MDTNQGKQNYYYGKRGWDQRVKQRPQTPSSYLQLQGEKENRLHTTQIPQQPILSKLLYRKKKKTQPPIHFLS